MLYSTSGAPDHAALRESGTFGTDRFVLRRVLTASELNLVRQIIAIFLDSVRLSWPIHLRVDGMRRATEAEKPECMEWLQKWQHQILPALPELRVTTTSAHRLLADDPQCDPSHPYADDWRLPASMLAVD